MPAPPARIFRQRSLPGVSSTASSLRSAPAVFKQHVFPDVRGHHLADLARLQQHAGAETVGPARLLETAVSPCTWRRLHLGDQVLRNAAQAEAAGEQRPYRPLADSLPAPLQ